jgi:uncharacterized membrane protein YebE (DUF533 family)
MMNQPADLPLLMKILIGAAWLDGEIQPQEREYLWSIAREWGLADSPEILPLLEGTQRVSGQECENLVKSYRQANPQHDRELLEAVSGSIYSDGEVSNDEAKLLMALQSSNHRSVVDPIVDRLRQLYRATSAKLGV